MKRLLIWCITMIAVVGLVACGADGRETVGQVQELTGDAAESAKKEEVPEDPKGITNVDALPIAAEETKADEQTVDAEEKVTWGKRLSEYYMDEPGNVYEFIYDQEGRELERHVTYLGEYVEVDINEYDENGNVIMIGYGTDPDNISYTYNEYDENNNMLRTLGEHNHVIWQYEYDSEGRQIEEKEFNSAGVQDHYKTWEYGADGNKTTVEYHNDGGRVVTVSDSEDKIISQQWYEGDALGSQYETEQDMYGNDTSAKITYYYYDGDKLSSIDQSVETYEYEYDEKGRIITKKASSSQEYIAYGITDSGEWGVIEQSVYEGSCMLYEGKYNDRDELIECKTYSCEGADKYFDEWYTLELDDRGNETEKIYLDEAGNMVSGWRKIYDEYGNELESSDYAGNGTWEVTYKAVYDGGKPLSITYYSGTEISSQELYEYDSEGRTISWKNIDETGTVVRHNEIEYF